MNLNPMKSILIFTLSFGCFQSFGQTGKSIVYDQVDVPAEYPGGRDSLISFIKRNMNYPEVALKARIEEKCYLSFIVSEKGEISNIVVKKGVPNCPECDEEAIRILKVMPKWKPAKINGYEVSSSFSIPIKFFLEAN